MEPSGVGVSFDALLSDTPFASNLISDNIIVGQTFSIVVFSLNDLNLIHPKPELVFPDLPEFLYVTARRFIFLPPDAFSRKTLVNYLLTKSLMQWNAVTYCLRSRVFLLLSDRRVVFETQFQFLFLSELALNAYNSAKYRPL
jgi:hypothetical protein